MDLERSPLGQPFLHTTRFLQTHKLEELTTSFSVTYKRHKKYPALIQLKYDQLSSNMSNPIVQECRGLLLEEVPVEENVFQYRVLSFPYTKFFNHNEKNAASIDWTTAQVYEKIDGSLAILYWYNNEWNIASSATADGSGVVYRSRGTEWEGLTFSQLFWDIWKKRGYSLPSKEDQQLCFMFEMFSTRNQVVVTAKEDNIFLHGVRDIQTFQELNPDVFIDRYHWNRAPRIQFSADDGPLSIEKVVRLSETLDPSQNEGFVVVDAQFNRIKVKSPLYVLISLLSRNDKDKMNKKRMLEIVQKNEGSEFISYFPQWKHLHDPLKEQYDQFVNSIEEQWQQLKVQYPRDNDSVESARAFGMAVNHLHPTIIKCLWMLRKEESPTARAYFSKVDAKRLEQLLPKIEIDTKHRDFTKIAQGKEEEQTDS